MLSRLMTYLPYFAVGVIIGLIVSHLEMQTGYLEDLMILAHEQRRMAIAAAQRDLHTAAASAAKEQSHDA